MDYEAGDPAAGHYDDGNRAFLQAFMARGTMTMDECKQLLAAIFTVQEGKETTPAEVTDDDFTSFLSAAVAVLSPFDYEIRSAQHQIRKERIYVLVNSVSDPMTQLATIRSAEEISYVKRFLDAMFETYNTKRREIMAISSMQALETRIRKAPARDRQSNGNGESSQQVVDRGLTSDQTEKLLKDLQDEKWITRSRDGFYTLSPRALVELRSWLVDVYNDSDDPDDWQRIKFCEACKDIITIGQRCMDTECNVRLHNICERAYWNSRPQKKCPKCDRDWLGKHYVGEKAVTTTEEFLKGRRRSGGGSRRQRDGIEEEAEEADEEADEEAELRRKRERRQQVEEVAEEDAEGEAEEAEEEEEEEEEESDE